MERHFMLCVSLHFILEQLLGEARDSMKMVSEKCDNKRLKYHRKSKLVATLEDIKLLAQPE